MDYERKSNGQATAAQVNKWREEAAALTAQGFGDQLCDDGWVQTSRKYRTIRHLPKMDQSKSAYEQLKERNPRGAAYMLACTIVDLEQGAKTKLLDLLRGPTDPSRELTPPEMMSFHDAVKAREGRYFQQMVAEKEQQVSRILQLLLAEAEGTPTAPTSRPQADDCPICWTCQPPRECSHYKLDEP